MQRKNLLALALCVLAVLCATVRAGDMVESPTYKAWAKFKPGSSVTMQGATEAGGMNTKMKVTSKLLEVTDDHASIEITTTTMIADKENVMPAQKIEVKKMVDKAEMNKQGRGFDPDLLAKAKEEKITVPAGTFDTRAIEFDREQGPMKMNIKMWYSDEVPGGSVKMEVTGSGQMTMHTTMELASVDKK